MLSFQVVNIKALSGISKTQRPYSMLAVSGIVTSEDGVMEVGEVVFMEGQNRPLPTHLRAGQKYEAVVRPYTRDGKISFEIGELRPIVAAQVQKAA
jgi:hypothetical protein